VKRLSKPNIFAQLFGKKLKQELLPFELKVNRISNQGIETNNLEKQKKACPKADF